MAAVLLPEDLWELIEPSPTCYPTTTKGWKAARARSRLSHRHPVRAAQRHSVADAASGTRLWIWYDVLAAFAGLAAREHLGFDSFRSAGLARSRGDLSIGPGRSWTVVRSVPCTAVRRPAPNPTDRAKRGSKRHLICDARGVPLAVRLTGANRHDSQEALTLVDGIPPLQGERGRPRRRPHCVIGDRGYDAEAIRYGLRVRGIVPLVAMRRTRHGSGLGRWRWVVERTFAWLNQFRRLRVRYDKRADIHEAFLSLGCALICWRALRKRWSTG